MGDRLRRLCIWLERSHSFFFTNDGARIAVTGARRTVKYCSKILAEVMYLFFAVVAWEVDYPW